MMPFDSYPQRGRVLLGTIRGSNCRKGYGLKFMRITGQTNCAYCQMDLTEAYENWLQMALDHVVPRSVCLGYSLSDDWTHDASNLVLACAACNGFGNRYKPHKTTQYPTSLEAFYDLRDQIFAERSENIRTKHDSERAFHGRRPWQHKHK